MKEIKLKEGEEIKVKGQKETYTILENVNGEIWAKIGYDREKGEKAETCKECGRLKDGSKEGCWCSLESDRAY